MGKTKDKATKKRTPKYFITSTLSVRRQNLLDRLLPDLRDTLVHQG